MSKSDPKREASVTVRDVYFVSKPVAQSFNVTPDTEQNSLGGGIAKGEFVQALQKASHPDKPNDK